MSLRRKDGVTVGELALRTFVLALIAFIVYATILGAPIAAGVAIAFPPLVLAAPGLALLFGTLEIIKRF